MTFHILHDNTLTEKNRANFQTVADKSEQIVKFYNVDELCADKIQFLNDKLSNAFGRYSVATFYRLMLSKNFFKDDEISRIIYLDSDVIVNTDIWGLWNNFMGDREIAAVPEVVATRDHMITDKYVINTGKVEIDDYFCAGVMMFNLDKLDENFFEDGVNWLIENPQCECPDQDILNNFFSKNYLKLGEEFDAFVSICRAMDNNVIRWKIYHYAGNCLGLDMHDAYNRLFFNYFAKTPWFNVDMIGRLHDVMRQLIKIDRQTFGVKISEVMSGRQRAFVTIPPMVEAMTSFFAVGKGEEIVTIEPGAPLDSLIKSMKKARGKKVYFIVAIVEVYAQLEYILEQAGFVAGRDFINAAVFLPEIVPINLYPLVKAM